MPGVEAPTATTTGWALRRAEFGGPDGCESDGQNIPFARTKAARKLQKDGFLVEEDVQRFVDEAEASSVLR